jgi:CheY-like chemotaxis protein/quercetin dioxygenase-like cupin family protein
MPRVEHPWGSEEIWAATERYVGKTILLHAGASTTPERHPRRDKTLRVQRGLVTLHLDRDGAVGSRQVRPGESVHVPAGATHRLVAVTDAEIVEVSTPDPDEGGRLQARPAPAPVQELPDPDSIIDDRQQAGPAPPPLPPRPAVLRLGAKVVVVVEDDLPIQDILVRALGVRYTVHRADDGVQGLALLEALPPVDLVVTDLMMPRMNGLELLKRLRADPARNRVPVIILTARTASGDVAEAINAGARSYLTKPFKLKELLAQVEKIMGVR